MIKTKIVFDGLIYYLQTGGGISRYIDELINHFSKIDSLEVVVLMRKNKIEKTFNANTKVQIINSNLFIDKKIKKYISLFFDRLAVNKFLSKNDLSGSIFHYSYYTNYKKLKAKKIITVHDLIHEKFPNFFGGLLNKIYLNNKKKSIIKADKIISISEQTKIDLLSTYNINKNKIDVIYHGINNSFRTLNDKTKRDFLLKNDIKKKFFIFVGNRALYKNFEFLIKTFSKWKKKDEFDLYCIGGGKKTPKENILINNLNISDNVKFLPKVSEEDLVSYYNCSFGLLFPSLYEGFGFPILESMACGTLVAASNIDTFKELGGCAPFYFSPHNEESLIEALDLLSFGDDNRIALGLEISKKYTWESTVQKTLNIYKK